MGARTRGKARAAGMPRTAARAADGAAGTTGGAAGAARAVAGAVRAVSAEVRASFAAWLERNFRNPRAGRIGSVSYARAGELDDAAGKDASREGRALWYAEAYERALIDHIEPMRAEEADFLLHSPLVALQLALGVTDLRGLRCLRRGLTHEVNRLQARTYRARYYARDNARRRALAAERRRIARRTTTSPCPTPEALRAAFAARGDSPEAKVRLGSLLEDLECHVDNRLRFGPGGEILGRSGGVRGWLRAHAPELAARYKTLMRHKALARRLRQAAGLADPVPASAVFDGLPPASAARDVQSAAPSGRPPASTYGSPSGATSGRRPDPPRAPVLPAWNCDMRAGRRGDENYYAQDSHLAAERRLAAARALVEGSANTFAALFKAVDGALGGDLGDALGGDAG